MPDSVTECKDQKCGDRAKCSECWTLGETRVGWGGVEVVFGALISMIRLVPSLPWGFVAFL